MSQEGVRSTTQRQGSFSHWRGLIFLKYLRQGPILGKHPAQRFYGILRRHRTAVWMDIFSKTSLAARMPGFGNMNNHRQQITHGIYYDVPFLPFVFPSCSTCGCASPYIGARFPHCSSVKLLGYDFRPFSLIPSFYHYLIFLSIRVLTPIGKSIL